METIDYLLIFVMLIFGLGFLSYYRESKEWKSSYTTDVSRLKNEIETWKSKFFNETNYAFHLFLEIKKKGENNRVLVVKEFEIPKPPNIGSQYFETEESRYNYNSDDKGSIAVYDVEGNSKELSRIKYFDNGGSLKVELTVSPNYNEIQPWKLIEIIKSIDDFNVLAYLEICAKEIRKGTTIRIDYKDESNAEDKCFVYDNGYDLEGYYEEIVRESSIQKTSVFYGFDSESVTDFDLNNGIQTFFEYGSNHDLAGTKYERQKSEEVEYDLFYPENLDQFDKVLELGANEWGAKICDSEQLHLRTVFILQINQGFTCRVDLTNFHINFFKGD